MKKQKSQRIDIDLSPETEEMVKVLIRLKKDNYDYIKERSKDAGISMNLLVNRIIEAIRNS